MKKITVVVAVVLVALFAFAACSAPAAEPSASTEASAEASTEATTEASEEASEPAADGDATCVIGLNAGTESNQFHSDVNNSIKNVAAENGVEVLYAVSEFDAGQIIPKVESLLQQGANVIVDFNVNGQVGGNLIDVVKEAGGKGVIGVDVEYISASGEKAWFMGANNQVAGELCGQAIADYALENKDGKVEYLVLFYNSENGDEVKKRMSGAIDGLKSKGIEVPEENIEYIDLGGGGSETTIQGRDKMTAWLTAHPDAHSVGVVAVNDETTTGALAAAETLGRQEDCIFASHNEMCIRDSGKTVRAQFEKDGKMFELQSRAILAATGVRPNTEGLNLKLYGIKMDRRGYIEVDGNIDVYKRQQFGHALRYVPRGRLRAYNMG